VLVTNPWNGQAYCVLRALRPHAARLVATRYREHGVLGRLAPAAVSRFADAVYPVPLAVQDWHREGLREENSAREEAYVQAVLEIARREALDVVFPTWDPEVCVLSRNKARFTEAGVTVPVPEWAVLRATVDKYAVARAAAAHGVACPRTHLPRDAADARAIGREINCRLGYRIWCEIEAGFDVPLAAIQIERGESVPPVGPVDRDRVYLSPVEDALALLVSLAGRVRRALGGSGPDAWAGPAPGLRARLRGYRDSYRAPDRSWDWYFRALRDDPLAGAAWYATHLLRIAREARGRG
jgi:hypothetical protein